MKKTIISLSIFSILSFTQKVYANPLNAGFVPSPQELIIAGGIIIIIIILAIIILNKLRKKNVNK